MAESKTLADSIGDFLDKYFTDEQTDQREQLLDVLVFCPAVVEAVVDTLLREGQYWNKGLFSGTGRTTIFGSGQPGAEDMYGAARHRLVDALGLAFETDLLAQNVQARDAADHADRKGHEGSLQAYEAARLHDSIIAHFAGHPHTHNEPNGCPGSCLWDHWKREAESLYELRRGLNRGYESDASRAARLRTSANALLAWCDQIEGDSLCNMAIAGQNGTEHRPEYCAEKMPCPIASHRTTAPVEA